MPPSCGKQQCGAGAPAREKPESKVAVTRKPPGARSLAKRAIQLVLVSLCVFTFLGAGDESRFADLGHRLMCVCSCNQVLLECNHVGCPYSDRMRNELAANVTRGDSDDLVLQAFVQKYGPTVLIAPTATGFNRVAWIVPYLVLGFGLVTAVMVIHSWRNPPGPPAAGGGNPEQEAELDRFREQARKDTKL